MKISALPQLPANTIDGTETVPAVKDGQTRRSPLAALLAPFVGAAEALVGSIYDSVAEGIAETEIDQWFAVDNGDGTVTIWHHGAGDAAVHPRTLATTMALESTDPEHSGAGKIGLPGGGRVKDISTFVTPQMFGAAADGVTDDTAAINLADAAAAASGKKLVIWAPHLIRGQILHSSGVTWQGDRGRILMDKTNSTAVLDNGQKHATAMIRSRAFEPLPAFYDPSKMATGGHVPADANMARGCRIEGDLQFRWTDWARETGLAINPSTTNNNGIFAAMPIAYYTCHDLYLGPGVVFDCGIGDWTFCHFGDNFLGLGFRIEGGRNRGIYGDGFHTWGGDNGTIIGAYIESGDDAYALANSYGNLQRNWFIRGTGFSSRAALLKLAVGRLGATAGYANAPMAGSIDGIDAHVTWVPAGPSRNGIVGIDCGYEIAHQQDQNGNEPPIDFRAYAVRGEAPALIRNVRIVADASAARNDGLPLAIYETGLAGSVSGTILTVTAVEPGRFVVPGMGLAAAAGAAVAVPTGVNIVVDTSLSGTGGPGEYRLNADLGEIAGQDFVAYEGTVSQGIPALRLIGSEDTTVNMRVSHPSFLTALIEGVGKNVSVDLDSPHKPWLTGPRAADTSVRVLPLVMRSRYRPGWSTRDHTEVFRESVTPKLTGRAASHDVSAIKLDGHLEGDRLEIEDVPTGGTGLLVGKDGFGFRASMAGAVMTVTEVAGSPSFPVVGTLSIGSRVQGALTPCTIVSQLTGDPGKAGTYEISVPQAVSEQLMYAFPPAVGSVKYRSFAVSKAAGASGTAAFAAGPDVTMDLGLFDHDTDVIYPLALAPGLLTIATRLPQYDGVFHHSTVPATHTGGTSQTPLVSVTIPGLALGRNGSLELDVAGKASGTAGTKTLRALFGSLQFGILTVPNTGLAWRFNALLWNEGAHNAQATVSTLSVGGFGQSANPPGAGAVNSAIAQNLVISGQLADAADSVTAQRVCVTIRHRD